MHAGHAGLRELYGAKYLMSIEMPSPAADETPATDTTPTAPAATEIPEGDLSALVQAFPWLQERIDDQLGKRLAKVRSQHEQEVEQLKTEAGKSAAEVAEARLQQAQERINALQAEMARERTVNAATAAATMLDADPTKIPLILKLAELPAPGEDGVVDGDAVKAAVEAVLEATPEWKRGTPKVAPPVGGGDRKQAEVPPVPETIEDAVAKYFA